MTNIKKQLIILICGFIVSQVSLADKPDAGELAPDFEITLMDGTNFKLSDYKGKKSVYLVFWNTWCHYCLKKVPKLKHTQDNFSEDIEIIAVNTTRKDSVDEMKEFQQRFNINYPLAFDTGEKVTDLYNVWGTPTEFIIDINGVIRYRDNVPDSLENYLGKWNTIDKLYSGLASVYFNTVAFFTGAINHSESQHINSQKCNETVG